LQSLTITVLLLLSACGGNETSPENADNPGNYNPNRREISSIFGGGSFAAAAADESVAADVGREVLEGGGNATDAAVAMYFAMAVTLPSAAGLGASGACIVHDAKTLAGEMFIFAPTPAPGPVNGQTFMVPSGVRAVTLMQIRHGKARWEMDMAPAERLARFGTPVSRALSRDLRAAGSALAADSESRRVLFSASGAPLAEGDRFTPTTLGSSLAAIRQRGGGDFFQGNLGRLLSDQITQLGGSLPLSTLRAALPQTGTPPGESYGGYRLYVAPAPLAGATVMAGWNGQAPPDATTPTDSGGISGLAAIDDKGNAAACSLSMGQLFGTRVMVPSTGILLGAATPNAAAVSPLVIGNPNNGEVKFAGAGGGGPFAAFATGAVARATVAGKQPVISALRANGGRGGWVNAIACPEGIRASSATCQTGTDPSGGGLAVVANVR
jgi:gamma-glutamyltranspeptidase/glutathione hydrolase